MSDKGITHYVGDDCQGGHYQDATVARLQERVEEAELAQEETVGRGVKAMNYALTYWREWAFTSALFKAHLARERDYKALAERRKRGLEWLGTAMALLLVEIEDEEVPLTQALDAKMKLADDALVPARAAIEEGKKA